MSVVIEGYNDAVGASPNWVTLSTNTGNRVVFIQARSNVFVRKASDPTNTMVVLGETSGSVVDLGINPPNDIQVQAISGTAIVSMYSLDPGERR